MKEREERERDSRRKNMQEISAGEKCAENGADLFVADFYCRFLDRRFFHRR
jgi:hypothetical protein